MKLFGYSISLNVLILIGILYLIMVVNALSSSCNREGLSASEIRKAQVSINNVLGRAKETMSKSTTKKLTKQEYLGYEKELNDIGIVSKDRNIMNQAKLAASQLTKYVG